MQAHLTCFAMHASKPNRGGRPQWSDVLALSGDTADNVPGVAGVGPKTALALLQRYGDLEGVLSSAGEARPQPAPPKPKSKAKPKHNLNLPGAASAVACQHAFLLGPPDMPACLPVESNRQLLDSV